VTISAGSDDNLVTEDICKEVADHMLPFGLSEVTVESKAIVGDVWRLACRGAKWINEKRYETKLKYEQFYEIAQNFTKEHKGTLVEALSYYKTLCLLEMNVAEEQQRRITFATPSKRLVANTKCKVAPPSWMKPGRRNLFFNCETQPPDTPDSLLGEFDEFGSRVDLCVICGYRIILIGGQFMEVIKCKRCKRSAHGNCVEKLFLVKSKFHCSLVSRFLGENSVEIDGHVASVRLNRPVPRKMMCLICGGEGRDCEITCAEGCGFRVHEVCLEIHA